MYGNKFVGNFLKHRLYAQYRFKTGTKNQTYEWRFGLRTLEIQHIRRKKK